MSDAWTAEEITTRLRTHCIGRTLELHAEIGSTNTRATELARAGAPDGMLVLADLQTAGRGRLGRQWFAPPDSSLLMSLILRPPLEPSQAQRATMLCALAAIEAIRAVTGLAARIKWPNDLVLDDRKVGGVLTELGARATTQGPRLDYVIVGMGINVNLDLRTLPEMLTPPASLLAALGRPISRLELLVALLHKVDEHYAALLAGASPHAAWRAHLATLGQAVRVGTPEEVIEGLAEDVDADGALLVRTSDGLRRILVGDVTLRGHRLS